jgi:molybdenum cofactor cytidylyltransferase
MKFGPVAVSDALGAVLAHATTAGEKRFRKAHVLGPDDLAVLQAAGIETVVAARLSADDLSEDVAATQLAEVMRHAGIEARPAATGRVNLYATQAGVFTVEKPMVDGVNAVDPAITIATIAQHSTVEAGQMVATVKIIPFAVAESMVGQAAAILNGGEIFAVHPFRPMRVGIVQTFLPSVKESVLAKTIRVTQARLARSGSLIGSELRTQHDAAPVAAAITSLAANHDMVIVFGASALCDFDDVIPTAIRAAGGKVLRAGMPVDPGNLLVLGQLGETPVIGAPGCARSPKENGFDWVLDRLIAGLEVTSDDIAGMGVGGLLMEIPTRPQPREIPAPPAATSVHAIVLAAGRSSRMGGPNKLMALFSDKPLIRQAAERTVASRASATTVVTGHQAARIREAVAGLDVKFAHNPDFAEGLSGSLKAGIAAVPPEATGALIVLGDMPVVSSADLDRLISAFQKAGGQTVVRATHNGKRGNPVLLPRSLFAAVAQLQGDTGARHLVEAELMPVIDVEIGEAAGIDVDTRDALESAGGVLQD